MLPLKLVQPTSMQRGQLEFLDLDLKEKANKKNPPENLPSRQWRFTSFESNIENTPPHGTIAHPLVSSERKELECKIKDADCKKEQGSRSCRNPIGSWETGSTNTQEDSFATNSPIIRPESVSSPMIKDEFLYVDAQGLSTILESHLDQDGYLYPYYRQNILVSEALSGNSKFPDELQMRNQMSQDAYGNSVEAMLKKYSSGEGGHPEVDVREALEHQKKYNSTGKPTKMAISKAMPSNSPAECLMDVERLELSRLKGEHYKLVIIDCRYNYEFRGGHVPQAVNVSSPTVIDLLFRKFRDFLFSGSFLNGLIELDNEELTTCKLEEIVERFLRKSASNEIGEGRHRETSTDRVSPVFVFHCEFSMKRSPKMMRHIRSVDRSINQYPQLTFPQMFLLKDGYQAWIQHKLNFACAQKHGYIEMSDPAYTQNLNMEDTRVLKEWTALARSKPKAAGGKKDTESPTSGKKLLISFDDVGEFGTTSSFFGDTSIPSKSGQKGQTLPNVSFLSLGTADCSSRLLL